MEMYNVHTALGIYVCSYICMYRRYAQCTIYIYICIHTYSNM